MRIRWIAAAGLGMLLPVLAAGAQDATSNPLEPLSQGSLVIWVLHVGPGRIRNPVVAAGATAQTPLTYQEKTVGELGQDASTYGKASSDVGKPSDTPDISVPPSGTGYHEQTEGGFGQTSSSTGTTAGNYGQTASSYGQTAGSYGTEASNTGRTAGSFGHGLDTIAGAGNVASSPGQNPLLDDLRHRISGTFPQVHVHYVSVATGDLADRLAEAQGQSDFPDLLLGSLPKSWLSGLDARYGMATLRATGFRGDGLGDATQPDPTFALLSGGQNPKQARALVLWLTEDGSCAGCVQGSVNGTPQENAAIGVARRALEELSLGEGLGELADPAIAQFPPTLGRLLSMPVRADGSASSGDHDTVHMEAVYVHASAKLAVVGLRLIVSSRRAFGVAHPLVVLRKQEDGSWRVLHVSLNLPATALSEETYSLSTAAMTSDAANKSGPKGISKASPVDGDTRSARPDLWWDNNGGASLQVVEWQIRNNDVWTDPELYMVPDAGAILQTRVTAGFASSAGLYRWRVWSVGAEGAIKISPWSEFTIVP